MPSFFEFLYKRKRAKKEIQNYLLTSDIPNDPEILAEILLEIQLHALSNSLQAADILRALINAST